MPDTHSDRFPGCKVHPTAIVEAGVALGHGTSVWDNAHIRHDTTIGDECIVGGKTTIAYGVRIGHRCKLNSFVYVCTGVTLEDGVMVSAGTVFTNDRFPRAATPDLKQIRPSDPDADTLRTLVREGATIGANCTVGCGLTVVRFAMVGMGAVVTKSVPDFALVIGHPAVRVGSVCRCGHLTDKYPPGRPPDFRRLSCTACGRRYYSTAGVVTEVSDTDTPLPRGPLVAN